MHVQAFPLGPLDTNCYLIYSDKEAVAVDPGGPPAKVVAFLEKNGLALSHVFLTHLHFDHTYGVRELAESTGAKVFASEKDRYMLQSELGRGGMWGLPAVPEYTYQALEAGELPLLGATCTVLATPGHSPGGLSFYFPAMESVFAGDSLFYRSIGRTDLPGGDHATLLRSIRDQLFTLPETTRVYCGHGDATSIGDEQRNNPYASDFSMI